ncbi:MAG: hypothetical protein ROZ64_02325 [Burkholderiaceae bacterium]|jgi:hypothetical protein|nr:hypothetical protein [Burkholderiaceae bacterium]
MPPTHDPSKEASRQLEMLESVGLELTPQRLESIRGDLEAVRRNVERLESLDFGFEDPAITFADPPVL